MIDNSPQARVKSNIAHREAKLSENKAVFFSLLSESIYTYGRLAGIREIISNALDSTIRAKGSRPIEIKAPSSIQPSFSVRDFGTGLTDKEIDDLYTCLGASSKKEVEDEVGFFGVGALSPFAYVESFNVQSFKDGLVRLYTVFMNERGIPEVASINESKTNEPNGLCVSYNVKREDIISFVNEIHQTLTYIEPDKYKYGNKVPYYKDVIKADKNLVINFDDKIFISNKPYYGSGQKNQLVMGGVCYEFDPLNLNKDIFQRYVITIEAPIGAVSVQASREKLKLNTKTNAYIKEIVNYIYKNIEDEVQKQVDSVDNFWAAINIVERMNIVKLKEMKWRGHLLDIKNFLTHAKTDFTVKVKQGGKKYIDFVEDKWNCRVTFMNDIVLDDTKNGGLGRIAEHCNFPHVVFIQVTEERTNKFIEKFGNLFRERASKLPEPVKAVRSKKSKKKSYEIIDTGGYGGFTFASRTKEFIGDYEEFDGYYIVCKNRSAIYNDKTFSISDVYDIRMLTDKKIIIIDWESDKPPKGSCFIDFFIKKYFILLENIYKYSVYNKIIGNSKYNFLANSRKDFKEAIEKFKVKSVNINSQYLVKLAKSLGLALPSEIMADYQNKLDKVIEDNYPLMLALDYRAYQKPLSVYLEKYLLTGNQEVFKNCLD